MITLSEKDLRASLVNATRREASDLTAPRDVENLDWESLDLLGWHDPRLPKRSYVVTVVDGAAVGAILRQTEVPPRSRAQCSWCEDVRLPNPVVFFSARRAGAAGREGSTVGTLVCADFECSANVRKDPPLPYPGFDRAAARVERIRALRLQVAGFVGAVQGRTAG